MNRILNLIPILLILCSYATSKAQTNTARSGFKEINLTKTPKPKLPPILEIKQPIFSDGNDNILDAGEKAMIRLNLANNGKGTAYGIKIKCRATTQTPGLILPEEETYGDILPGTFKAIEIPINAATEVIASLL